MAELYRAQNKLKMQGKAKCKQENDVTRRLSLTIYRIKYVP